MSTSQEGSVTTILTLYLPFALKEYVNKFQAFLKITLS
jgi:hypothetical protein